MNERPLPPARGIESLKNEARRWLRAIRAGDPAARARLTRAIPGCSASPTLREVQHALAREHGFDGWGPLLQAVAARHDAESAAALARYEEMAVALLDAYRTGAPDAMERHYRLTWHRRAWPAMRRYVQLDLGKRPTADGDDVEITLDDARWLVAVEHGYRDWAALEHDARGSGSSVRRAAKPIRVELATVDEDELPLAVSRDFDEIARVVASHPDAVLRAEGQMTDAALARLCGIEAITALDLGGSHALTDDGVRHLARLPHLRQLDLRGTAITDRALAVLPSLPALESLSVAQTAVTDEAMPSLAHCRRLTSVDLASTRTGDGAIRALVGMPALRELHTGRLTTDAGLSLLAELPMFAGWHGGDAAVGLFGRRMLPNRLTPRGRFTPAGLRQLARLAGLFALDMDDPALGAGVVRSLSELRHLAWLSLDATDDHMPALAALPALRYLSVQDTATGDDGFAALAKSRTLEVIWGRRSENLGARGLVALSRMPALRSLSVSLRHVGDGAAALPDFASLRELMPIDLPDTGYRHVARCTALESLILMYCRDTTDAATEHVVRLPRLGYYFNSYTTITDRTPRLLASMDSLERVTFDACHALTDAGVGALARLPRLRVVRVAGRGITPAVAGAFPASVRVFVGG